MLKQASVLLAIIAVVVVTHDASAQRRPKQNKGDLNVWAVSDLSYNPDEPALLGARVADPLEYPATFYSAAKEGRCTSTMVGPRVLLTAAHCVGNGASVKLRHQGKEYKGSCTHSPDYAANVTADWALCVMQSIIPTRYERISTDPATVRRNQLLLLTGFGCTRSDGTGGNDGIYRIGEAPVQTLPRRTNYDIVTKGKTALCFGDSGGPAFAFLDPARTRRVQVSVNSRGNIQNTSYLSALSTPAAIRFLGDWKRRHGVQICGMDTQTPDCR